MAEHGSSTLPAREAPPYFDILFARLAEEDPTTIEAFGRHVHWGHWEDPSQADGTAADYAKAAENLCRRVSSAAAIKSGQKLLDVGCGFGGTIASLNERFTKLDMTGVNIDQRQLDRATEKVRPQGGNKIKFVQADACRLSFPKASLDIVMAV
jgi:cyclopropane fatty-acyl-phospholipid synthase-like methyltransferase